MSLSVPAAAAARYPPAVSGNRYTLFTESGKEVIHPLPIRGRIRVLESPVYTPATEL